MEANLPQERSRNDWLQEVGNWTYAARLARAQAHFAIAAKAAEHSSLARWHEGRARGQLERIERVEDCGSTCYELACNACGVVAEGTHDRTCSSWRYCVRCRGTRANRFRERIDEARAQWRKRARSYERERFLTLTMPHAGAGLDVRSILAAWERFTRGLRRWLRKRGTPMFVYVRVIEITPSDGGHVHIHAWIGSTFLPHAVLRVLWGRALGRTVPFVPVLPLHEALAELDDARSRAELVALAPWRGAERAYVPWPVLDVRQVRDDVASELVKYLVKDVEHGELIDPMLAANLIEASEGTRVVACSRAFWVVEQRVCEHCGDVAVFLILPATKPPLDNAPRGPP